MSIANRLKSLLTLALYTQPTELSHRAYHTGIGSGLGPHPQPPGRELRPVIKSLIVGIPWWTALVVAYLYWLSASGQIAPEAMKYGVFKTALAVVLTMAADFSLFFTASVRRDQMSQSMRLMARAVIFLGVCWMLSIA
jgi:hypothetical protein